MAEVLRYGSSIPSFSEILDIISRWNEREQLNDRDKEQAKEDLELCLEALKDRTDGMSEMVRGKVEGLLDTLVRAT